QLTRVDDLSDSELTGVDGPVRIRPRGRNPPTASRSPERGGARLVRSRLASSIDCRSAAADRRHCRRRHADSGRTVPIPDVERLYRGLHHPEYPSAHSFSTTAITDTVARFFGTNKVTWTLTAPACRRRPTRGGVDRTRLRSVRGISKPSACRTTALRGIHLIVAGRTRRLRDRAWIEVAPR